MSLNKHRLPWYGIGKHSVTSLIDGDTVILEETTWLKIEMFDQMMRNYWEKESAVTITRAQRIPVCFFFG